MRPCCTVGGPTDLAIAADGLELQTSQASPVSAGKRLDKLKRLMPRGKPADCSLGCSPSELTSKSMRICELGLSWARTVWLVTEVQRCKRFRKRAHSSSLGWFKALWTSAAVTRCCGCPPSELEDAAMIAAPCPALPRVRSKQRCTPRAPKRKDKVRRRTTLSQ